MSLAAERRMPILDAVAVEGGYLISMPDGQAVIAVDASEARRIVDRNACGSVLRFSGPAPRSAPDGTGPRAMGALGPEESQERSEASGPLAMPPGALPAAADRALSRGHAHAGLVEPGASSHPRLHPLTSSDTAAAPRGQRAGEIGPSGP